MARESEILRDILIAVSARPGAIYWRNNVGILPLRDGRHVKFGLKGSADIIGCDQGRAVAIEVKSLGGKQSVAQRRFQIAWENAGGLYTMARSPEEATAFLDLAIPAAPARHIRDVLWDVNLGHNRGPLWVPADG